MPSAGDDAHHIDDPGNDVLTGVNAGDAGRLGDIAPGQRQGTVESLGRDLHTVLSRETLGAGLDLADADTLQSRPCGPRGSSRHKAGHRPPLRRERRRGQ